MIDLTKIIVKAGDGGNGAVDFARRRGKTFGPPNGGDGGKGGDVYLLADSSVNSLIDFNYRKHYEAENGRPGAANQKTGENGKDVIINVPVGTIVFDSMTKLQLVDMAETTETVLIAAGGQGGRGNFRMRRFASHAKRQIDWEHWQQAEPGKTGEQKELVLELKLIADIGIIGLPNAGKSTLLSVLTAAKPKIANYPFTTLQPNLGIVKIKAKSYVMADIPGLIAGASEGRGLGKAFLRHIERTRVLLHLTQHYNEYTAIRKELALYNKKLLDKPEIIILAKTDTMSESEEKAILKEFGKTKLTILPISAVTHKNIPLLLHRIENAISKSL